MNEVARLFFIELTKVQQTPSEPREQLTQYLTLLNKVLQEATRTTNLQLTTVFARLAYICQREQVPVSVQAQLYAFRQHTAKILYKGAPCDEDDLLRARRAVAEGIAAIFHSEIPTEIIAELPAHFCYELPQVEAVAQKARARVMVTDYDVATQQLIGTDTDSPTQQIRIQYGQANLNEPFQPTIAKIISVWQGCVTLNLVNVRISAEGVYYPEWFVVEPDFLIDVSAIAECFQGYGQEPMLYLLSKFKPRAASIPIMVGNVANFFLDELMHNKDADFKTTFPKIFQQSPLAFSVLDDAQVKDIGQSAQKHFVHLKQMVHHGFEAQNINPAECTLEPSFYSELYGIQGRLDLLHRPENDPRAAIVELKSGKPFQPNRYGLSNPHYTQTLLYDLLIRSVFNDENTDPLPYILYSALDTDALKFATPLRQQQTEAIQVRNQIVAIEEELCRMDEGDLSHPALLWRLRPANFPQFTKGFTAVEIGEFAECLEQADDLERKYFTAFVAFTAREHRLSRTGVQGNDSLNGLAALWLNEPEEKKQNFELLSDLRITHNQSDSDEPLIIFEKTADTNPLANFRDGDIAVLYPYSSEGQNALRHQIFKCTIIENAPQRVIIKLRFKQFNQRLFSKDVLWNLEHDVMDSSYNAQFKGLAAFLKQPKSNRQLLLTTRAPLAPDTAKIKALIQDNTVINKDWVKLTEEQQRVLAKALVAPNYFLLVGPPGTGKTSFMLRYFVKYILEHTDENLLLLAYTNRAVDEICEAIDDFAGDTYLRLGSGSSSDKTFSEKLLSRKIAHITNRKDLKDLVAAHRVVVSTVSSMQSNTEILQLKSFERVVIDEASQILEPMLIDLLCHFKRFVLIGDDKQLPAVVQQDRERSAVADEDLHAIGLYNRRNSFFERLYKRAQSEGWDWAYDMLSAQGRMHADIVAFPSQAFYNGQLGLLPNPTWQHDELQLAPPQSALALSDILCKRRVLFFNTPLDRDNSLKTNQHEARLAAQLVKAYRQLWAYNDKVWTERTLGIITPYRAQIAQIRAELAAIDEPMDDITIDTVERYQGGARDIIIISVCLNSRYQLDTLVSLSDDGLVDRKLNVALTRARQHLVMIGNESLLREDKVYAEWVESFSSF